MSDLLKINVNDHTEKKNGLTYLSWAWAWAEVLKIDPKAVWWVHEYAHGNASELPAMFLPDGSAMVKVSVKIKDDTKTCLLPVMNHRNQAIKNPDAFAINTAIMRCLAKAISMHGLGLYIYAGEDLPEGDDKPEDKKPASKPSGPISAPAECFKALDDDTQRHLRQIAQIVTGAMPNGARALDLLEEAGLDNDQRAGLWYLLDSATRSALKAAKAVAA